MTTWICGRNFNFNSDSFCKSNQVLDENREERWKSWRKMKIVKKDEKMQNQQTFVENGYIIIV